MLLSGLKTLNQNTFTKTFSKYKSIKLLFSKKHNSLVINRNCFVTDLQPAAMAVSSMSLSDVVKKLNDFASTSLAESWDNVGLLIEPTTPRPISHIFLTNDLTEAVMKEAVDSSVEMIIAYHPPIFAPLKRISNKTWKERIVATCLENRIALYSPHTSFDAVKGGVNDWLAKAFDTASVKPLIQSYLPGRHRVDITLLDCTEGQTLLCKLQAQFRESENLLLNTNVVKRSTGETVLQTVCSESQIPTLASVFFNSSALGTDGNNFRVVKLEPSPLLDHGMGRLCQLSKPTKVKDIVRLLKIHLDMDHLRLALAVGKDENALVSTVALCAGSGASVLKNAKAELFLTGEMLHHDVLDAVHNGSHVILTNHSDSERGFLPVFAKILATRLLDGKVHVSVSKQDHDPLKTV